MFNRFTFLFVLGSMLVLSYIAWSSITEFAARMTNKYNYPAINNNNNNNLQQQLPMYQQQQQQQQRRDFHTGQETMRDYYEL